jgi:DNA mismatch endonuclease (patch repair protein)
MQGNRRRDTRPELRVRSALHLAGYRFRVDHPVPVSDRTVRVDIAFTKHRLAVFIDGCFWHSCPQHGNSPRHNAGYWAAKLQRNVERDVIVTERLRQAGWTVLRMWEHTAPEEVVGHVAENLPK